MAKIAKIKDDISYNFDDGWLYEGNKKVVQITGRESDLLRCFCEAPNQYLSFGQISDMVANFDFEAGKGTRTVAGEVIYFSPETIKPWKTNLLKLHPVFKDKSVIDSTRGKGYIYYGQGIVDENLRDRDNHETMSANLLPHELTGEEFINASDKSVLYREKEFTDITNILETKRNVLLTGMGGRGKTSIARLVYGQLKEKFDCCGWINYNGDLKQSMISALKLDDYSDETMTENDIQKKWKYITKLFANNNQSKLFVIDNVDYIDGIQSPLMDQELRTFSGLDNAKIIITSRLPQIVGFDNVYPITNLGEKGDCNKCVELFYYYNPDATDYRSGNKEIVEKLCEKAGYNAMVIELLAKASRYDYDSLEKFYFDLEQNGFKYMDETPVDTVHDFNKIEILNEDGTVNHQVYDRGNETAASQLMKLFDLRTRSEIEKQILWDFHCLPEAEHVSKVELKDWMGYSIKDIDSLRELSWIKYENGFFYMHPLVSQAVSCKEPEWEYYWNSAEKRRIKEKTASLVTKIKTKSLYCNEDSFSESIRKIYFSDYLSYEGRFLNPDELLYIADYARKRGVRDIARKYYKISYNKLYNVAESLEVLDEEDKVIVLNERQLADIKNFWKSVYFYGYILSYTRSGYDDAERCLALACKVIQSIGRLLPREEAYRLQGMSFDHYGYVKSNNHKNQLDNFVNACMLYRLAIMYREKLTKEYPDNISYYKDYAWSLDNLGTLFAMADYDHLEGEKGSDQSLCIGGNNELFSYENEYQFFMNSEGKAEEYLKSALEIRVKVGELRGDKNPTEVAWTCCNIASLLTKYKDRYADAEKFILDALNIYDELNELYPEQHASSQARTYAAYGRLLAKWEGRKADALEAFKKALEINGMLEHDYPGVYSKEIEDINADVEKITKQK